MTKYKGKPQNQFLFPGVMHIVNTTRGKPQNQFLFLAVELCTHIGGFQADWSLISNRQGNLIIIG